jgi:Fic family protein
MRSTGTYVTTTTLGEPVRCFVPRPLPPARPVLALESHGEGVRRAELALGRLSAMSGLVPSVDWLQYSAIRKEALLTSQIEGTQATLVDLFDEETGLGVANADDVEEVTNYLATLRWVREHLRRPRGLPISAGLLCEAHRLLLQGVRGARKQPGAVHLEGDWEGWVAFFLAAVEAAAAEAERGVVAIASLVATDRRRLLAAPKAGAVSLRLFELLPMMPRFNIEPVRQKLATTFPTATAAVKLLEELGIVVEMTGQKKNRSFSHQAYVELLAT